MLIDFMSKSQQPRSMDIQLPPRRNKRQTESESYRQLLTHTQRIPKKPNNFNRMFHLPFGVHGILCFGPSG